MAKKFLVPAIGASVLLFVKFLFFGDDFNTLECLEFPSWEGCPKGGVGLGRRKAAPTARLGLVAASGCARPSVFSVAKIARSR